MERDAIDLGTLKVSKLFKKLFIPTVLGMLSIASVTIIDGIFVGNGIGSDGIAAVIICVPVLLFFIGFGLMLGMGCSVVTSIHLAKNKVKVARINVSQSFAFATIVLSVATALIMIFPEKTGRILGSSEVLLPSVVDYLLWFVPSLLFDVWTVMALFIIRLDGSPKFAMWISMLTAVINIVLDWLFIFPFGWGVMGAAFASTISVVTGGILVMYYLFFKAKTLKFHPIKRSITSYKLALRNIGYHCQIGFPAFLGEATLATLTFLGNIAFMEYLGEDGVGAFGIASYYLPCSSHSLQNY